MLTASREAKIHTSWHKPNAANVDMLKVFTDNVFQNGDFIAQLQIFVAPLILSGRINSLAQTLLKMTAPGVPARTWDRPRRCAIGMRVCRKFG